MTMKKCEVLYGNRPGMKKYMYILEAMEKYENGGNAYITADYLYKLCRKKDKNLDFDTFTHDLAELFRLKIMTAEKERIYLTETWRYEERAAEALAHQSGLPPLAEVVVPAGLSVNNKTLIEEQRAAVQSALSNRLSMVLGGAGCGKSMLIRAILQYSGVGALQTVLCAPTGKAARVLTAHTGIQARTVHSALGVLPNEDFLAPVAWNLIRLVIVDEASMMTLGMLAGILNRIPDDCRVVLLGDPNQLLSVGSGNVIPDLLALNIPRVYLEVNHRLAQGSAALMQNVQDFKRIRCLDQLLFDNSFRIDEMETDEDVQQRLVSVAAASYLEWGNDVQVLTPFRDDRPLSAAKLNDEIRKKVNPISKTKKVLKTRYQSFVDGDRVIITQNDREHNVSNGDVGVMHIWRTAKNDSKFSIELPDGRMPVWEGPAARAALEDIELAYALTVHKSQGSEYELILMPFTQTMGCMLYRNLLYTAISRARQCVCIYGSRQAIDTALQNKPYSRFSKLVEKTRKRIAYGLR